MSKIIPKQYIIPFVLIGLLFPLWGFANDITNPLVAAFKNILLISHFESALVQFAFYGGYCLMAIPAAIFIKRFNYKQAILNTTKLHGVSNGPIDRMLFKISIFEQNSGVWNHFARNLLHF